jgi:hypothetical protein
MSRDTRELCHELRHPRARHQQLFGLSGRNATELAIRHLHGTRLSPGTRAWLPVPHKTHFRTEQAQR